MNLLRVGLTMLALCSLAPESHAQSEVSASIIDATRPEDKDYAEASQFFRERKLPQALAAIDRAVSHVGATAQSHNMRGAILTLMKRLDEAEDSFKKARELDPKLHFALFNLAEISFLKKDYALSLQRFNEFRRLSPDEPLADYKIFLCRMLMGEKEWVRQTIAKSSPSMRSPLHYFINAAFLFHTGKPQEAYDMVATATRIYDMRNTGLYMDSLVELGWVKLGGDKPMGTASGVDVRPIDSLPNDETLEALMPSTDGPKKQSEGN